jgi:hypothetical protein
MFAKAICRGHDFREDGFAGAAGEAGQGAGCRRAGRRAPPSVAGPTRDRHKNIFFFSKLFGPVGVYIGYIIGSVERQPTPEVFASRREVLPGPRRNVTGRGPFWRNVTGQKLIKGPWLLGCNGVTYTKNKCYGSRHRKDPMFTRVVTVLRVQRGREMKAERNPKPEIRIRASQGQSNPIQP